VPAEFDTCDVACTALEARERLQQAGGATEPGQQLVHLVYGSLRWDSIETIKKFAGPDPGVAIVEPEGRAGLTEVDEFATHHDVALVDVRNT
jgi:hypothetical protein